MNKDNIIISSGEPSGIGPDLIVKMAQYYWPIEIAVCADPDLLLSRAHELNLPLKLYEYKLNNDFLFRKPGELNIIPFKIKSNVCAGKLNINNSEYVINMIDYACKKCLNKEFKALITGPVHKGIINASGIKFTGHTEYLSKLSNKKAVMMLVSKLFKIALVTTHIPIKDVSKNITKKLINNTVKIVHNDLKNQFCISDPVIYVCGLNPHAGEEGFLGKEENEIIIPELNRLRNKKYKLIGPLPADTIFQNKYLKLADVILTMYHDQGLPVLKYCSFSKSVNVTLGLPFIRTSVDHGTALDIAGKNIINDNSIKSAINLTIKIIKNKNKDV